MKGWIYVITNQAMPGLVKVGYSTKDPELRAGELNHTGSPHPYLVEYELLIDEPYQVEQKTHRLLSSKREAKEWFRCSPEEAVVAIKQSAGNGAITETYKRAERARAEALHQQQLQKKEEQLKQQQAEQKIENRLVAEEAAIRQKYQQVLETECPLDQQWIIWLLCLVGTIFGVLSAWLNIPDSGAFIVAVIAGLISYPFIKNHFEEKREQTLSYMAFEKQRDKELAVVRAKVTSEVLVKIEPSNNLPADTLAKLKKFVGTEVDEVEIAKGTIRVEEVIGGLLTTADCRKIAIGTKVKMAVNAPKQNVINMIAKSYPGIITDRMAANIFDALAEP